MSKAWCSRFVATIESRMQESGWRDSLSLRASPAIGPSFSKTFARDADVDQHAPDQHLFRIASATKVYVAAAILRLVEERQLQLDDRIADLLSRGTVGQLAQGGFDPARITVDHLMRHISGMTDHSASDEFVTRLKADPEHRWTRTEQIGIAMALGGPLCTPGSTFHYADTGYLLLGEIVERTTATTLPLALRALLGFDRLGLVRTFFDGGDDAPAGSRPRATQWFDEVNASDFDPSFDLFGGGGLVSTLEEIEVFLRGLFDGKVFRDPRTLASIFAAVPTECGFDGFGHNGLMFRKRIDSLDCWGHTGFWGVLAAYLPERRASLTATFNRSRADGAYDADALLHDFAASLA